MSTLVMNISQLIAVLRGFFYRLIYVGNLHVDGAILAMQANSSIEIFNKNANVWIGKFVFLRKSVSIRVDSDAELRLGEKVFINDNCTINCAYRITIGAHTKIAPNVCINDHDHNYKQAGEGHLVKDEVTIGSHVWIGSNAVILKGATIGDNAVIAAGSIVKGNVPPNTLFVNRRENQYIPYTKADGNETPLPLAKGSI
ncbi:acyltransferase [Cohnella soli]|uniref:Acyltransferase n=1 Tax=Cohnella soli TaxID=425005 RepID=A0ABW0I2J1_9BACL